MSDSSAAHANPMYERRWWSLVAICLVTSLVWFTASDISIALPSIAKDFPGVSMDTLQWAVNGYFLAGALIIVGGRIGDVFGRRLVFAIGTILILVGSVVAGLSQSPLMLIIGRVIEGVGAAAVLPTALAMVVVLFHGRERETAIATWIAVCWGAQALGPLLGGLLIQLGSWRGIFWINLPIGIIALILMWRTTPETREEGGDRSIDYPGAATLVAGIGLILYGLTAADNVTKPVLIGIFLAAILLLVAFVLIERRSKAPVVVLSIFKKGRFDAAVTANLIANFVFGAVVFFMSQYLQTVMLKTPLQAGLLLLPATIPILLLNPLGTIWGRHKGPSLPTVVGMLFLITSAVLFTRLDSADYSQLLLPFILLGIGIGLQITPCAVTAVEDPGDAGEGVASGIYKASSMIGGALGVAVCSAVFQISSRGNLDTLIAQVQPPITPTEAQYESFLSVLSGGPGIDDLAKAYPQVQQAIVYVFDAAVGRAMWPCIVAAAIGAVLALFLLRGRSVVNEDAIEA
ncbi:MAG: MFS transporter [Actinomycetes bacterium]